MSHRIIQIRDLLLDVRKLPDGGIGRFLNNLLTGTLGLLEAGVIDSLPVVLTDSRVIEKHSTLLEKFISLEIPHYREFSLKNSLLNLLHPQVFQGRVVLSPHISGYLFASNQVATIHDCIHLKTLPWYSAKAIMVWLITRLKCRVCREIITVSQASKRDIVELLGISEGKIKVVPNAFFSSDNVDDELSKIEGDYLLAVFSNTKLHKNFQTLIDVWQANGEGLLVVVAPNGTTVPESSGKLKILSDLSDGELSSLYYHSRGLIIPSLQEGFCLPALEAAYWGAKVFHLRVPAIQELFFNVAEGAEVSVDEISQEFDNLEDLVSAANKSVPMKIEVCGQVRKVISEKFSPFQMALEYWRAVGLDV